MIRALTAAVAAGLAIAACGSGSPSGGSSASSPAARAVQHALTATRNRAYHESFTENISLDTSGLPAVEAQRLTGASGTIVGTADVTNAKDFHIVVTLHGQRAYVRAAGGHLSVSRDGVNYQPAPAPSARLFSQLVSLAPGVVGHVQSATSLGTALLAGQTVSRYSATIPGNAVAPVFSALNVRFGKPGPLHFVVDVSRSSGLPVRVIDSESASFDLAKLNRPGVTGSFTVRVSTVRNFTYR